MQSGFLFNLLKKNDVDIFFGYLKDNFIGYSALKIEKKS